MEAWQILGFVFLLLLPLTLMLDFWPHRERLDHRGRPVPREWERQVEPPRPGEDHH